MTTILRIDASARGTRSLTRRMTQLFVDEWRARRPDTRVIARDIGRHPPPFVTEAWIAACFTPPANRTDDMQAVLTPSDELIAEVRRADIILIGSPMYNYGMPAALKAWFDQVIRVDETFTFDLARGDFPIEPVLSGKTMVILSSRGEFGFQPGGVREGMNHLDTHLRSCGRLLGVAEDHLVATEYQEFGGDRHERSAASALASIPELVARLTGAAVDRVAAGLAIGPSIAEPGAASTGAAGSASETCRSPGAAPAGERGRLGIRSQEMSRRS